MAPLSFEDIEATKRDLVLKYAIEFYKFEIENFWKRTVFAWGLIAAAFIAYGTAYDKDKSGKVIFLITSFGLLSSIAWTLINRGSKYWYEAWEQKVKSSETHLGGPLFSNEEPLLKKGWLGAARFSVSRLTIALSDLAVLVWAALWVNAVMAVSLVTEFGAFLGTIAIVGLACLIFTWGQSGTSH